MVSMANSASRRVTNPGSTFPPPWTHCRSSFPATARVNGQRAAGGERLVPQLLAGHDAAPEV